MPRAIGRPRIVTLTTDFGYEDSYVAEVKGVLLAHAPRVSIVDVTHAIRPQDVLAASIVLERAVRAFPAGTIHLAVVDPGVGSDRKLLVARMGHQTIICPDNGLITWPWRRHAGGEARELTWRPTRSSATFHGRDIMAPVAGRIAAGAVWRKFCGGSVVPSMLGLAPAALLSEARIIHVDRFGNATTNVPAELIENHAVRVRTGRHRMDLKRTYAEVAVGKPLALIGSSGLLEIAVRNGSAAKKLKLKIGMRIDID